MTTPPANVRLWVFRNADETSYNGTHGTLYGPWPTVKFIDTTTGTVAGNVVMYPASPSNSGHNFGIWLKGDQLTGQPQAGRRVPARSAKPLSVPPRPVSSRADAGPDV